MAFHLSISILWAGEQEGRSVNSFEDGRNLLGNSGFESGRFGLNSGLVAGPWSEFEIVNDQAWEGRKSLCIRVLPETLTAGAGKMQLRMEGGHPSLLVETDPIRVTPGKSYVLSAYVRGEGDLHAFLGLRTTGHAKTTAVNGKPVSVTSEWQRLSVSIPATANYPMPGLLITLGLDPVGGTPGKIWFDGVQLEEGTEPTDYRPKRDLDLVVNTTQSNNIYNEDEAVTVIASIANGTSETKKLDVPYVFTAWDKKEIKRGTLAFDLPPGARAQEKIVLGKLPKGHYLGDFELGDKKGQVVRIAVINQRSLPLDTSANNDSFFGLHWRANDPVADKALAQAGARWMKVYQDFSTPSQLQRILTGEGNWQTRWDGAAWEEAVSRKFGLNTYIGFGILPVWREGVLERVVGWPWMRKSQPQNPQDFEKAIELLVNDTKDWNSYIESFNEVYGYIPITGGTNVSGQMDYFKQFYEAVKKADPAVKVMHNVVYEFGSIHELLDRCMAQGLGSYMDILAFHFYGMSAVEPERFFEQYMGEIRSVMQKYGAEKMPLWMTEGGAGSWPSDEDPYRDPELASLWQNRGTSELDAARWLVRFHLSGLSLGVQRFFYFMASDWTRNSCGLLRYDGLPRPSYSAYAAMTELLEGRKFVEKVALLDDTVRFYVFENNNGAVVAFSKGINGIKGSLLFPADGVFKDAVLCDMMGALLPWESKKHGRGAEFDDSVRYLVLPGAKGADAATALKAVSCGDIVNARKVDTQFKLPTGTTFLIEAETPIECEGKLFRYSPYMSGGKGWGYTGNKPSDAPEGFRAKYSFEVIGGGSYGVWIAAAPPGGFSAEDSWVSPMEYRVDDGEWKQVSTGVVGRKYSASGPDSKTKDIWWMKQGPFSLSAGQHTMELRVTKPRKFKSDAVPMYVFNVDAIAITIEKK